MPHAQAGVDCDPEELTALGGRSWGLALDGDVAYVASQLAGLYTYDVSDPANPALLGSAQTDGYASGVAVESGLAYVADVDGGLLIFDVSVPAHPVRIAAFNTLAPAVDVAVVGDVCYLAIGQGGLQIVDVSDPSAPAPLGSLEIPSGFARRITLAGDYAYISALVGGLQIVDVSLSASPTLAGSYVPSTVVSDVHIDGNLAYVASGSVHVLNIVDPTSPNLVTIGSTSNPSRAVHVEDGLVHVAQIRSFEILDPSSPLGPVAIATIDDDNLVANDLVVRDGIAYFLDEFLGLLTFDVSTPTEPVFVASIDTVNEPEGVAIDGDMIAVVDVEYGLRLVDVSQPDDPRLLGLFPYQSADGGVEIAGDVVYAGDNETVEILDISDPLNPVRVSTLDIRTPTDMARVGDLLYVVSSNDPALTIVNVADPSSPVVLGTASTQGRGYDIAIRDDLAYLACGGAGLQIVDISDPANPMTITPSERGGQPDLFTRGVDVAGDYAYLADRDGGLRIYSIADPFNTSLLNWSSVYIGGRDVSIVGLRAFVTGSAADLVVYDLAVPQSPQQIAFYNTGESGTPRAIVVQDDVAYIAKDFGGLFILDVETCIPAGPADLSGDGAVDATDLAILIAGWGSSEPALDLDSDGVVGTSDLAILLAAWS